MLGVTHFIVSNIGKYAYDQAYAETTPNELLMNAILDDIFKIIATDGASSLALYLHKENWARFQKDVVAEEEMEGATEEEPVEEREEVPEEPVEEDPFALFTF